MSELLGANVAGRPGPAPHAGAPPARELRSGILKVNRVPPEGALTP